MSNISHILTIPAGDCELLSTKFSPDDLSIACGCSDGTLKVFTASGSLISSLPCYDSLPYPVTSIRFRPQGSSKTKNIIICTTCEGLIYHYHISSGKTIHIDSLPAGILSCDFSQEGTLFAIGCDDSSVRLLDETTKTVIRTYGEDTPNTHHCSRVTCVKWVNSQCFWTGGWDKNVICWDIRARRSAKHFYGPKICGEAIEVWGDSVVTGAYEVSNQLQIWDNRSCRKVKEETVGEEGDRLLLYCVKISKGKNQMLAVAGSGKNTAYFYDLVNMRPQGFVSSILKPVYSVDFAENSDLLALASADGSLRVFSV